jgi:hypothetical protein
LQTTVNDENAYGHHNDYDNAGVRNCDPIITKHTTSNNKKKTTTYHINRNSIVTALENETLLHGYQSININQLKISDSFDDCGGLIVGLSPPNESSLMQRRLSIKSRSCNVPVQSS